MKETVLDVLMYLIDVMVDEEEEYEPDRYSLREELQCAGFGEWEIERALEWLDGLNSVGIDDVTPEPRPESMRIYDGFEQDRLNASCRGYLLHLEQVGILSQAQRELVIDRLLALHTDEIDCDHVKWVVMMVLFSQPGQEQAYMQMEDLVFTDNTGWLH